MTDSLAEGIELFDRLKGLLDPGGTIIPTTPDVLHPTRKGALYTRLTRTSRLHVGGDLDIDVATTIAEGRA